MNLATLILTVLKISILLSVFAIGLKTTFGEATFLLHRPGHLGRALLSMNVVMPLVAVALASTFDLNPAVKVALLTLSVSPTPPIFPNRAFKAGGKSEYTIGLLVATSLLSIVLIPITVWLFERIRGGQLQMSAGAVSALVLSTILAPLLIGIVVRALMPSIAERAAKPVALIGMVLLTLSALTVLIGSMRTILSLVGDGTVLSLSAFALVALISGHLLGGPEPENRPVLALATATRHPAVALTIAHADFPNQKLAVAAIFAYLIVSAILSAPYLNWVKRAQIGTVPAEKHA